MALEMTTGSLAAERKSCCSLARECVRVSQHYSAVVQSGGGKTTTTGGTNCGTQCRHTARIERQRGGRSGALY